MVQAEPCRPFVLERSGGQIAIQDAAQPLTTLRRVQTQAPTDAPYASNPQTLVAVGDQHQAVLQSRDALLAFDLSPGGAADALGRIDLDDYSSTLDIDSQLEASDALLVEDRLYVALGRYYFDGNFQIHFDAGSVIAVIDTNAAAPIDVDPQDSGVQGILLQYPNPWRGMIHRPQEGTLWVASTGAFDALDGAVEAIDLSTQQSLGAIATEAALGAEIDALVAEGDHILLQSGRQLYRWDETAGQFDAAPWAMEVDGVHLHQGVAYVWATSGPQAGLRAIRLSDGAALYGPVQLGSLPIRSIAAF
ncbi:MAG: hypothetical protein ACPGUV_13855 [Polyangiales bacterium]